MFNYNTRVTGNVRLKMNEVVMKQQELYKTLSKLIGDAMSDYDLIGNLGVCNEAEARLGANYMQMLGTSKEYMDKVLEANVELAAAIDDLTSRQKAIDWKLDRVLKLLEKKN